MLVVTRFIGFGSLASSDLASDLSGPSDLSLRPVLGLTLLVSMFAIEAQWAKNPMNRVTTSIDGREHVETKPKALQSQAIGFLASPVFI
jgi:hypothetical protein